MPVFENLKLNSWFLERKRDFPWRKDITPYRVWISEVMLQQTRAEVVVPYFIKWMKRFPTVKVLAESSLESIIKTWEGLGYYSRARNLHFGAQQILRDYGGNLPSNADELFKIKGLGPYTVNAILSFGFHQKAFPLDGNAIRVLTRFFGIEDDISKAITLNNLRKTGESLLTFEKPWVTCEALIELGATVCSKKPQCHECPLKTECHAYNKTDPSKYPFKAKKITITPLKRAVAILRHEGNFLLKKEEKGLMADLYEFPYFSIEEAISSKELKELVEETFPVGITSILALKQQKQSFTRYRAELFPFLCTVILKQPIEGYQWVSLAQLKEGAFSSGHRRILHSIF